MQFHAERAELIDCVAGWVRWHGLSVVIERFYPEYEPVLLEGKFKLRCAIDALEPVRQICLVRGEVDIPDDLITTEQFMTVYPDCLAIALEPVTEDGLRETALATISSDPEVLAFWMKLVLELDEIMHKGAVVIDPLNGRQHYFPEARHTPAAHDLALSGVRMLACAGDSYFEFGDLCDAQVA